MNKKRKIHDILGLVFTSSTPLRTRKKHVSLVRKRIESEGAT